MCSWSQAQVLGYCWPVFVGTRQTLAEASDLFPPLDLGTVHHHRAHLSIVPENDHTSMESTTKGRAPFIPVCQSLEGSGIAPLP